MTEEKITHDDVIHFETTNDPNTIQKPFVIIEVTKNRKIIWNEVTKDDARKLEYTREDLLEVVKRHTKYGPFENENGLRKVLLDEWQRVRDKYVNVIPKVDGGNFWYYIKISN